MDLLATGIVVTTTGAVMGAVGTALASARQHRIDRAQRLEDEWRARMERKIEQLWRDVDREGRSDV
ncbi:MAG: hypothetical protein ACYCVN_12375 [Acidimicrobiales bacterium]